MVGTLALHSRACTTLRQVLERICGEPGVSWAKAWDIASLRVEESVKTGLKRRGGVF